MRMGRLLKCVLAVAVLLSIFSGITALAAGEVTVQVKDVSAKAGQTVTTELIMDGSFATFQGALIYDTDALTLENIEATNLISGSLTMFSKDEISGKFLNGSFISAAKNNMAVSGAVLKFTFSAGSKANGTYSFSVEQFKVYDEKGAELTVSAVDTTVVPPVSDWTTIDPSPSSTTPDPSPGSTSEDPSPSPTTEDSSPTPTTNDSETITDTSDLDSGQPDGINEPGDENSDVESNEENPNSDTPADNGWVIILLIILVVAAAGVVTAVIVVKKSKKLRKDQQDRQ